VLWKKQKGKTKKPQSINKHTKEENKIIIIIIIINPP
jgi:hypothetical protein